MKFGKIGAIKLNKRDSLVLKVIIFFSILCVICLLLGFGLGYLIFGNSCS